MTSRPGTLKGSGIRTLPADRVAGMLARIKVETGKGRRAKSVRYRVSGFRDPDSGDWVSRNPRNGNYYRVDKGRHRTQVRPSGDIIRRTNMIALEVEIDRGKGARVYHVSLPGLP